MGCGTLYRLEYGFRFNNKIEFIQQELNLLIDKAAKAAGSDYKLAKVLDIPSQHVSNWRHGRRTCTPEDQALMAHLAGLDPVQVLARAMVEKYEGKPKGDRLMRALGKASLATGAVLASAGASAMGSFSPLAKPIAYFIRSIFFHGCTCANFGYYPP